MKYVDKIVIEENGQLLRIPIEEFVVADHINSIIRGYQYVLSFGSDEVVFQEASLREQFVEMLVHNGYEEENARSFKKRKQVSVLLRDYTVDHLFSEGLASVQRDGKYGFINQQGKEVIPCQYDFASSFSEGLAYVEKEGKYGFVDQTGKEVIPCHYNDADDFREGFARVRKSNQYGFVDQTGEEIIPCQYDEASSFKEGFARVKKGNLYGFINQQGIEVIPCQYNYDSLVNEGFALVEENSKKKLIDREGNPLRLQILLQSLEDVTKISSGSVIEGTKVSYLLDFDNDVVSFSSEEERDNFLEAYENVTSIEKPKQMIKQKKR